MNKIIALIDMDCFFVQVEQRDRPETLGTPCAVTQYNTYRGGGIIAVNYEARAAGVTRQMRGEDAKIKCPNITLFHTPQKRGKADSTKYREASLEVFNTLTQFNNEIIIEKASIDEAYIDLTDYIEKNLDLKLPNLNELNSCFIEGIETENLDQINLFKKLIENILENENEHLNEKKLLLATKIILDLKKKIFQNTKFHCSAGISYSKTIAKLAAGMHKPKSQTIIPLNGIKNILAKTSIKKLRNFGGKLGLQIIEKLNINFVDEINNFNISQLRILFGDKCSDFIKNIANGIDNELVKSRKLSKSIGCGKNFSTVGTNCLQTKQQVEYWIIQLVDELFERLNKDREINNRFPNLLIISFNQDKIGLKSKSLSFKCFDKDKLIQIILNRVIIPIIFKNENNTKNFVKMLSISATKFSDLADNKLDSFFFQKEKTNLKKNFKQELNQNNNEEIKNTVSTKLNSKELMKNYFQEMETELYKINTKQEQTILTMFNNMDKQNEQTNNSSDASNEELNKNKLKMTKKKSNNEKSNPILLYNYFNQPNLIQSLHENNNYSQLELNDKKEIKRGFFFRKMLEYTNKSNK